MNNPDTASAERMRAPIFQNRRLWAGVAAVTLLASGAIAACHESGDLQPINNPFATEEAMPGTTAETCEPTWEMRGVEHGDQNRWFANGLSDVKEAMDNNQPVDAKVALSEWLNGKEGEHAHPGVKNDAYLLAAGYNAFSSLFGTPGDIKADDLKDDKNCANDMAVQTIISMEAMFAVSTVSMGEAPANGHNTGTDAKGQVTVAEKPGVTGDRRAINVTLPNGKQVSIMLRCGQPVLPSENKPNLPPGETDETPRTPQTTTTITVNTTIPMKHDDGKLPGDGTPAGKDKGTPGKPGNGPTGQQPGPDGYVPGEERPTPPQTTPTTRRAAETTQPLPPATTSPQPTNTKPPVPATGAPTTAPQGGTRPAAP